MAIKDLFIKSEESNGLGTQTKATNPVAYTVPVAPAVSTIVSAPATGTGSAAWGELKISDDKIIDTIWNKIIGENRPGPDYLELKNNVDALNDLPISDEQKITSAFKVLQKSYPNFKKDDIIKAIDFYINVVNNEKNSGLSELAGIKANTVDGVEREIKQMELQAEDLKRQYDELQTKIASKSVELTKARADLETKNNVFLGSVNAVMSVLESDKNRIMSINF